MSLGPDAAAARKAALEQLKFKKVQKQQSTPLSQSASPAPPPWAANTESALAVPPAQSRDATATSRYFPIPPSSSGRVLVPSSSPLRPDPSDVSQLASNAWDLFNDEVPGLGRSEAQVRPTTFATDPLSMPSGFRMPNGVSSALSTRPSSATSRKISEIEDVDEGDRPAKRLNTGPTNSRDPIDFLTPPSPEVRTAAPRPSGPNTSLSSISLSSDDSFPDAKDLVNAASQPRIIRAPRVPEEKPPSTSSVKASEDETRFTHFRLTHIEHDTAFARAAWTEAGGDEPKAIALLNDPSWKPAPKTPPPNDHEPTPETGKVKEVVEANRAQRLAVKEKGRKSMIYKNRLNDGKPTSDAGPSTPPRPKAPPPMVTDSPTSPEIGRPRKRLRRKVVESDSEPEFVDSDEEDAGQDRKMSSDEQRALEYYNETSAEGLQELTGCTPAQATKIIELRPFTSVEDLNTKLGQGKKKAGPAGISPRMFEDSAAIFEGYGRVDSILEDCEGIGADLRKEIASWTHSKSAKGKQRELAENSRDSSASAEDGAIMLTHVTHPSHKPKYYMSAQPSSLQPGVILKEYQMIGVNWLSLLYQKRLSCILADEMGLGKTVQVISFFAHLKERGRNGPHLIVVPSSTLENWCREFQKFAGDTIHVETYYADKNDRPRLRDVLNNTVASKKKQDGWNVLITTYNLAQGDDHDRKFFRKIEWDTCVYDEGHVLKNFQSQRYQALLRYKSRWRLLLTGTPLQNNLQELVSLMNFILPDHFADDLDSLRAVFKTKGDSKVTLLAQQRVSRAKKMMTPFVLRRRKDQVLQDLPKKTERIEWCNMTALQKSIYNEALQRSRKTIFDLETNGAETPDPLATNGRGKSTKKKTRATARTKDKMYLENSSNVLMDLRKASSHPMLFRRRFADDTLSSMARLLLKEPDFKKRGALFELVKEDMEVMTDSELQAFCATYKCLRKFLLNDDCYLEAGKIKVLMNLLEQYKREGRRILIFSQFTQILDILERVLDLKQIKYLVLTGSTPVDVRQSLVDEFNEDESIPVFLLSTKAGGMGINLTAASVVIMFDQDFNPHNDKQAQDRAYRIGQKRDVDVVKLITKGSIEEDMLSLGQMKLALDEAVAGEEAEERVEREMKVSLMNAVRKKLAADDPEAKDNESAAETVKND